MNDEVIIYPNDRGWGKIRELLKEHYLLSDSDATDWIDKRKSNGGYKEQLWVVINNFHSMYFNGQNYFKSTNITL